VPEGASLADTRKQLVLRTFASTSGDLARTAKIIGISPDEVRAEIASMVHSNGHSNSSPSVAAASGAGDGARSRASGQKTKSKKR
jgi:hypothetical protein